MELKPGQTVDLTVEKLSLGGDGIARTGNGPRPLVIFIPYSAPGDQVKVQITEIKKNYARGKILRILKEGKGRTQPPCQVFFAPHLKSWCGGCDFQHLNYDQQLKEKETMVKETLEKLAGISSSIVLPVIPVQPGEEWRSRNKMQVPFGKKRGEKEMTAGFYAPGTHEIVPFEDCLIHSQGMSSFVKFVKNMLNEWRLDGWLKHLYVREDASNKNLLAVFVTSNDSFPNRKEWIEIIRKKFPAVTGLCQNIQSKETNVILGNRWKTIFGRDFLIETLKGLGRNGSDLKLKVSAGSFFQVNTKMAEKLYSTAKDFILEEKKIEGGLLLDLYCGVGGIGLTCSEKFERLIGVEENLSSIRDAKENVILNGFSHCQFVSGDVERVLKDFADDNGEINNATVLLDPPRKGCSEWTLRNLSRMKPENIVYVSCEPSTLARDLQIICGNGYETVKVQPIDMFPQSSHIECVALIRKIPLMRNPSCSPFAKGRNIMRPPLEKGEIS